MSTTNNTQNQHKEHDPAADALVDAVDKAVGDKVPDQAKPLLNLLISNAAQWLSNWAGTTSRNLTLRATADKMDAKRAHQVSTIGDMAGRSLVSTILPSLFPAWTIFTQARDRQQKFQRDYAEALSAEGVKPGLLGGVNSSLEVLRHEAKTQAEIARLQRGGWVKNLFKKMVPDVLMNAGSMMISEIKNYSKYDSLRQLKAEQGGKYHGFYDYKDFKEFSELELDRQRRGAEATAFRDEAAKKSLEVLEKRFKGFIPERDGFTETQAAVYGAVAGVIPHGDFTLGRGEGQANFLDFVRNAIQVGYASFAPGFLQNMFADNSKKQIEQLQKKITAAQMIKALNEVFKHDNTPIRLTKMPGASASNLLVSDYLVDIFLRHHNDMGRPPLSGEMRRKLSEACDVMAAAMQDANRRLSPMALMYLVDSKKGIFEYTDGKLSGIKSDEVLEDFIQSFITDKKLTRKTKVNAKEYYRNFTREEMDASWKALSADEQMIWASNFPDEVLDDITGDKAYSRSLRTKHNDLWQPMFKEVVRILPKMSAHDRKEAGISDDLMDRVARITKEMRKDPETTLLENQEEVMRLTAEIGIRLEQHQPGSISKMIGHAKRRDAEVKGLDMKMDEEEAKEHASSHSKKANHGHDEEHDHASESRHFRDKVGEKDHHERGNWRDDVSHESREEKIRRLTEELEREKRGAHRRGEKHEHEEHEEGVGRYGRY